MNVNVGIMETSEVDITFNGIYSSPEGKTITGHHIFNLQNIDKKLSAFSPESFFDSYFEIKGVTIGKDFHWQQEETQRFRGSLKLLVRETTIIVINELPIEEYLKSVVSSEMKSTAPLEFLKAHAVISRSWLISQILNKESTECNSTMIESDNQRIRWYDHTQHIDFDVCADDHCQRYQGISRISNANAEKAINETVGLILTFNGRICDTRFSKCCGGAFEKFESCWGEENHPYLSSGRDITGRYELPDLTNEGNAREWIFGMPKSFCNTKDSSLLVKSLNGYDRNTTDFYRWTVEYTTEELSEIVNSRSGLDLGIIKDIVPLQRGISGRLIKIRIDGTKRSVVIGKELEIRRTLSKSHLYSSAFVVEKTNTIDNEFSEKFVIKGAGWGHGVGLCQIGAVVMADKGYSFKEILSHYYPGSRLDHILKKNDAGIFSGAGIDSYS